MKLKSKITSKVLPSRYHLSQGDKTSINPLVEKLQRKNQKQLESIIYSNTYIKNYDRSIVSRDGRKKRHASQGRSRYMNDISLNGSSLHPMLSSFQMKRSPVARMPHQEQKKNEIEVTISLLKGYQNLKRKSKKKKSRQHSKTKDERRRSKNDTITFKPELPKVSLVQP